jgi:hypothetical protein
MRIALGQDELSPFEQAWYGGGEGAYAQPAVMPSTTSPITSGGAGVTGSILDTIIQTGSQLIKGVTSPDMVKAAMNKFVFGAQPSTLLPGQPGYVAPVPERQWIAGVPNLYVMLGGAAILFFVLKGRK